MLTTELDPPPAAELRRKMVEVTARRRYAAKSDVLAAMAIVRRHQFVPDVSLEHAYDPWNAVVTHRFADGRSLSCASAPHMVGQMLDQLDVQRGHRVLEIGAGTGYNAALLAELVGSTGNVTTIDIDPDVTAAATRHLAAEGYSGVDVITGDGHIGAPCNAPYDRIIATVSPWDIPVTWWEQLKPVGRMVIPLRWRGHTQTVAFDYQDGDLVADSMYYCGFVPLVGDSEGEYSAPITDNGSVRIHWDQDQPIDPKTLHGVLGASRRSTWSGVTLGPSDSWTEFWLWLTQDPRAIRLNVAVDVDTSLCDPVAPVRAPAIATDFSLAYLTSKAVSGHEGKRWELGAIGHGPEGSALAERLTDHLRDWALFRTERPQETDEAEAACYRLVLRRTGNDPSAANNGESCIMLPKHHSVLILTPPQIG